jgi:hypothetical protein
MYKYLSGDVEINGPAHDPAVDLAIQALDVISEIIDPLTAEISQCASSFTVLRMASPADMWDAYRCLSSARYDVRIEDRRTLKVLFRRYVRI